MGRNAFATVPGCRTAFESTLFAMEVDEAGLAVRTAEVGAHGPGLPPIRAGAAGSGICAGIAAASPGATCSATGP